MTIKKQTKTNSQLNARKSKKSHDFQRGGGGVNYKPAHERIVIQVTTGKAILPKSKEDYPHYSEFQHRHSFTWKAIRFHFMLCMSLYLFPLIKMSVVSTKTTDYSSIVVSLAFPVMGLLMSFVSVWHIRNETKRLENAKDKYDDEQREKPNKNSDNGTPAESDANPNDVKDFGDKKKFYCIFSNKKRKTYKCNNDEKEKKYGEGCDYNDGAGKCNFIIENENYEFRMSRLVEIGFMLLSLLAFMIGFWLIGTYYGKITLTDISLLIPIVCSIVVYASSFLLFYKCKSFSRLILGQVRYREFNARHRDYWNRKGWSLFWIIIGSGPLAFIILFIIKIVSTPQAHCDLLSLCVKIMVLQIEHFVAH